MNVSIDLGRNRSSAGFRAWVRLHLVELVAALRKVVSTPLSTAMTVAVIGIALALPATLYITLHNLARVGGLLDQPAGLSLFMQSGSIAADVNHLVRELEARVEVGSVTVMSPEQARADYLAMGGERDALASLGETNPFPWVLGVQLKIPHSSADAARRFVAEIENHPALERVVFDQAWIERLDAFMRVASRASWVMALMLAVGVVLVVGNTIRLEVQTKSDEIAILKLFGATNGFVRRPFMWSGFWFGAFGAVLVALIVFVEWQVLSAPLEAMASSYGGTYALELPPILAVIGMFVTGPILGWMGAFLAVSRYLYGQSEER